MGKARATGGRGRARRTSATHHGSSSCTTRRAHPQKTSRLRASRTSRRASRRQTSSTSPGASTRRAPPYRTASRAAAAFACPRHRATGFPTTIVARNKSVARSPRSPKLMLSVSQATKQTKPQSDLTHKDRGSPPTLRTPRAVQNPRSHHRPPRIHTTSCIHTSLQQTPGAFSRGANDQATAAPCGEAARPAPDKGAGSQDQRRRCTLHVCADLHQSCVAAPPQLVCGRVTAAQCGSGPFGTGAAGGEPPPPPSFKTKASSEASSKVEPPN